MKIYDEEDLLRSLQLFVKNNLNTNIALINAEKTDFDIDEITADDAHYVFSGELLDLPNHAFVNFSIDGQIEIKSNQDDKISLPTIAIEVVFDNPKSPNTYFKSLRYMRALYQTILKYETSTNEVDEVQIVQLVPMVISSIKRELVISGVRLSIALG